MLSKEQFVHIIQENEGILFKVSTVYTDNETDREDLRQEMVYQLWKSFDSFKGNSKISTWIYRVALNTALVFFKRHKRRIDVTEINEAVLQDIEIKDTVIEDRLQLLYQTIRKLNEIERAIIMLYLENKNYEEIASITGFTATNIGTRLNRIKIKLKKYIKTS